MIKLRRTESLGETILVRKMMTIRVPPMTMITMKTEAAADLRPYIDIPTHAMPALEPNLNLDFELDFLNFSFPDRV